MSSLEDIVCLMTIMHPSLLKEIDAFLSETGMSASYFGKKAVGNSEVVSRLRKGRRVWPDTETNLRSYMMMRRNLASSGKRVSSRADIQGQLSESGTP